MQKKIYATFVGESRRENSFSHRISLMVSAHNRKHGTLRIVPVRTVQLSAISHQGEKQKILCGYIILFILHIQKKIVCIGP